MAMMAMVRSRHEGSRKFVGWKLGFSMLAIGSKARLWSWRVRWSGVAVREVVI